MTNPKGPETPDLRLSLSRRRRFGAGGVIRLARIRLQTAFGAGNTGFARRDLHRVSPVPDKEGHPGLNPQTPGRFPAIHGPGTGGMQLKGFKEFIMRGNLVELAVAVIIGTVFSAVVKEFTAVLMGFIGKIGGQPDFSGVTLFDVNIGLFINATITFLITAAVVYFCVVKPYNVLRDRFFSKKEEEKGPSSEELLTEIRDLLRSRG